MTDRFQLTHPTRGATVKYTRMYRHTLISTHTPHTGCDLFAAAVLLSAPIFQLTHPTRGATAAFLIFSRSSADFNSHTPHGVRQYDDNDRTFTINFNSHTPHGVRPCSAFSLLSRSSFQLTHPTRGATHTHLIDSAVIFISTHTPHTGCDFNA